MARAEFLGALILAVFLSSSNRGVIPWTQGASYDVMFTGSKESNPAQYETIPIDIAISVLSLFCYYGAQYSDDQTIVGDSDCANFTSSNGYDHL